MGGEQTLAETGGRVEEQTFRKEQGARSSTEANQLPQRDVITVSTNTYYVTVLKLGPPT